MIVDVGDVTEVISGIDGCYISRTWDPHELAALLNKAITFISKTNGRIRIITRGLENRVVAEKLVVYEMVMEMNIGIKDVYGQGNLMVKMINEYNVKIFIFERFSNV